MSDDFPRLLVATEFPPNASGGGPAVVRQMLKGWPVEKLSWWSCLPEHNQLFGQKTSAHRVAPLPPRLYPNRRWSKPKSWLLENVWTGWAARHLRQTLSALRPEVVWVIPHLWSIPPMAAVLVSGKRRYHTSLHDYADSRSCLDRFGATRCRWMASLADQLYATATTRDAISHAMVSDLRIRTGGDAVQIARAGLEQGDFDFLAGPPVPPAGEIRIAYAGTIVVEEAFEKFVAALNRIRSRSPVTLEFFASHSYRQRPWFDPAWMRERGNLPEPDLTLALRDCSWGFAPMALTDDDPRYNRFSFPTKFISYLAAGLPVLTLGHPESSVVKLAKTYDVGLCTTTGEVDQLAVELLAALAQPEAASRYRPAIVQCATAEFDARKMRAVLHNCFRTSAESRS